MTEVLQHRNYYQVAESNLEFIRGDIWDIEIGTNDWPLAVYNPGIDILKKRLDTMSISMNNSTEKIEKDIFNQHLIQNAGRNSQYGSVVFNFIDKEDQAITFMLNDWLNQVGDPQTGFGRHKKELILNLKINFYDTLLRKIRYYNCVTGILDTVDIPETPGEKGSDLSNCSMTIQFELMERKII
jgi:hypothetical protein